ncbi:MAG: hypothetical protein PWQ87_297 [Candidatus Woesearchaeota archaeon]|nr:hypothetical protein [Candidatus Woesearchaeota archaeon]
MQKCRAVLQSTKGQTRGVETIIAVVFVIIIIVILGSIIFMESSKRALDKAKDNQLTYVMNSVENFLNVPELKCSYFGKLCIDAWKAKAVSSISEEDVEFRSYIRRMIGIDAELKLVSLYPEEESFLFINTTSGLTDYSLTQVIRLPVVIENDTNEPGIGFGYVEVRAYLR